MTTGPAQCNCIFSPSQNFTEGSAKQISPLVLSFPHQGRVGHISLVVREMWDTTDELRSESAFTSQEWEPERVC